MKQPLAIGDYVRITDRYRAHFPAIANSPGIVAYRGKFREVYDVRFYTSKTGRSYRVPREALTPIRLIASGYEDLE